MLSPQFNFYIFLPYLPAAVNRGFSYYLLPFLAVAFKTENLSKKT